MTGSLTEADLDMVRFLAESSYRHEQSPWLFRPLNLPTDELRVREYEHETERLRRFIRGQNTNPNRRAA